jgi:acyl-CoA synthetase (AMP-forming)/AMP-acid ligase II
MPNTAEWPIIFLGALEAGLTVSTANPQYTAGKYTDIAREYSWHKPTVWLLDRRGVTN